MRNLVLGRLFQLKRSRSSQFGGTLIELIIATVLIFAALGGIFLILSQNRSSYESDGNQPSVVRFMTNQIIGLPLPGTTLDNRVLPASDLREYAEIWANSLLLKVAAAGITNTQIAMQAFRCDPPSGTGTSVICTPLLAPAYCTGAGACNPVFPAGDLNKIVSADPVAMTMRIPQVYYGVALSKDGDIDLENLQFFKSNSIREVPAAKTLIANTDGRPPGQNPPTNPPTTQPTNQPTNPPTPIPTDPPTPVPSDPPTPIPTDPPTPVPTEPPTVVPTDPPTPVPTDQPTPIPTEPPTPVPTVQPTPVPTEPPTVVPTDPPTPVPTDQPTPISTEPPTPVPTDPQIPVPTDPPTPVPTDPPPQVPSSPATPIPTDPAGPVTTDPTPEVPTDPPLPQSSPTGNK